MRGSVDLSPLRLIQIVPPRVRQAGRFYRPGSDKIAPAMNRTPLSPDSLSAKITGMLVAGGCLTVVIVLAAVFLGVWLDRILGTKPALTLLMLFATMPVSLILIYQIGMRTVKSNTKNPNARKVEDGTDE
jgi:hypothetical protein